MALREIKLGTFGVTALLLSVFAINAPVFGQASSRACPPVIERASALGTCMTAHETLGQLPQQPMFWHLDIYPTRAEAEAAKASRGTIVESLGKIWPFTITEAGWRPSSGERVAEIGPLPVNRDVGYTAVYMQSIFAPGQTAPIHVHSGPEAFYTLAGETCLETPEGAQVGRTIVVPGGPPMLLVATGTEQRKGLVLILHDSHHPATTLVNNWTPKGLCTK